MGLGDDKYAALGAAGYTGAINDREAKFWAAARANGFGGVAVAYVGGWESKPAANTVPVGTQIMVTGLGVSGASWWYSDGTKYRTLAPVTLTEYYNAAGLVFAAGGAEQLIAPAEVLLPANLLVQGAKLVYSSKIDFGAAAESRGTRLRLGVASGAAGTILFSNTLSSASIGADTYKMVDFVSSTETKATNGAAPVNSTTGFITASALSTTSALYLSPTAVPSASNAIIVFSLKVSLEV